MMIEKYKDYFIGIGGGLFIGLQMSGQVPGITDVSVGSESVVKFLGFGAAGGFFIGLANLSKANPNPYKLAAFLAFFIGGVIALAVNFHRGFIGASYGFNPVSVLALTYLPCMLVGGYAASVFSKNT